MKVKETFYPSDRNEWRKWLSENFETKTENNKIIVGFGGIEKYYK